MKIRAKSSVAILRSPEFVFSWLIEPDRVQAWMPRLVENRVEPAGPLKVGSRVNQVFQLSGRRFETTAEVTEISPVNRLGFSIEQSQANLNVLYSLGVGDQETRVSQEVEIEFRPWLRPIAVLGWPLIQFVAQRKILRNLRHLKACCEQSLVARE